MRTRTAIALMGTGLAAGADDTMLEFGTTAQGALPGPPSVLGAEGPAVAGGAASDGQHARMLGVPSVHGGQQGLRF